MVDLQACRSFAWSKRLRERNAIGPSANITTKRPHSTWCCRGCDRRHFSFCRVGSQLDIYRHQDETLAYRSSALSRCQAIVSVSIKHWVIGGAFRIRYVGTKLRNAKPLLIEMPSNTGYRAVDDSFQYLEDTVEEHAESIQLENSPFSKQAAAPQAIPPELQHFNSNKQTRKLFLSQSIRWIGTLIFVAFMLATLKVYQDKDNFSHDQKYAFNTIVTAFSLGLGLNFFVGQHLTSLAQSSVH